MQCPNPSNNFSQATSIDSEELFFEKFIFAHQYYMLKISLPHHPRLLTIAGNARNVGKTTLALELIRKYCQQYKVIGLKVSSIYPDDDIHHGLHSEEKPLTFSIYQEISENTDKDTSKMLKAGASEVYFVRSVDTYLQEAMKAFFEKISPDSVIICESRSLRKVLIPGLLVVIEKKYPGFTLKNIDELIPHADLIVRTAEEKFPLADVCNRIALKPDGWNIIPVR